MVHYTTISLAMLAAIVTAAPIVPATTATSSRIHSSAGSKFDSLHTDRRHSHSDPHCRKISPPGEPCIPQ
jgi:hypothetical protein